MVTSIHLLYLLNIIRKHVDETAKFYRNPKVSLYIEVNQWLTKY